MAPKKMVNNLYVNNLQIIDIIGTPKLALVVTNTGKYKLKICIKNKDRSDTFWYDNIQLRVVPMGNSIQFYADPSYQTKKSRFDSTFLKLRPNQSKWFTIYFKWTGVRNRNATLLKFDTGLYAQEIIISRKWRKLSYPI